MNIRIREQRNQLLKDILDDFECSIHCHIETSSETGRRGTSNILVYLGSTPRSSMIGGRYLRNNSHSSHCSISHNLLDLINRIDFYVIDSSILSHFGMTLQNDWEIILIDHMPVKNIHFVIHQPINGLQDKFHWQVMMRGINHQSPPRIYWSIIRHIHRQILQSAVIFQSCAIKSLIKRFQPSQKPDIGRCFYLGIFKIHIQGIVLLSRLHNRSKLSVLNRNVNVVFNILHFKILNVFGENIGLRAAKMLLLVVGDDFSNVRQRIVLVYVHFEQKFAWLFDCLLALKGSYCALLGLREVFEVAAIAK